MHIISSGKGIHTASFYSKKKKRRRLLLISLYISLLVLSGVLVYLIRLDKFQINEILVAGEEISEKDEVEVVVREVMDGNYFWFVPRTNALFYPRHEIQESLINKYPKFKSVELDLDWFQTLSVTIEERTPFALYCKSKTECYFMDDSGLVFARAPDFSGGSVYLTYTKDNQIEEPIGQELLDDLEFKLLSKFTSGLEELNIFASEVKIGQENYTVYLPNNTYIVWLRSASLALTRSNLEAFLSDESIRSQGNFLDKVQYLDLRTENKVFYKFK